MIFKTIEDETAISGQRIVGTLQARKIAQQQATAQLEVDIACLKKYEIACQGGSISTGQFDSIMKKASVTAKEYTVNIQKGTGSAQAYAQSQKANNAALQSVGIGAGIASKAVKLLSATMNTIAFTTIFSLISKGISWVTGQINNYIHRNEIAIEKAEELLNTFKSEIDEITSKQDKINGYADEFKELSEGVDDLGRNVSLTADEYSRYQNIVKEIVGINPSLISGYDEENNILADKNGLLETSIQLLKDEYNQKLKNLALPDNIDTAIEGAIGRYNSSKEDFLEVEIPTTLAFSGVKIDENGNRETGYVNQISKYIEDVIGVEFTGWEGGINQYILDNAEAVFDNLDKIKERASQTKDGWEGLNDSQLIDLMDYFRELRIAYNDMNNATTSANPTLQYVAMAEDSYSQLTDIQKKFIADYVNGIQVTSETTEQEKDNIRKSIISLTQELSNLDDINVNNALADLYAIPTDKQSIGEFIEQFRNALEIIKAYCKENGIEIPIAISDSEQSINDIEAQYLRAVDFAKDKSNGYDPTAFFKEHSINTQEEIDAWQKIAQGARDAAEAEKEYVQGSTLNDEPIPLFTQLTSSQEALDKFQSSIKSASDAYTTLLSGNYSSSELLDSIQTINQAVSDMGGSLDWEKIDIDFNSLNLLQKKIEQVSKEYAKSILFDAGIDVNSDFEQMLTNMLQQMFEVEAEFAGMNAQLDNLQSSYQTLAGILESYNETGYISLDNLQSLLTADENLISMLEVENGQLVLNQEAYESLVAAQLLEFKTKLNDAAASEIEALAKSKAEEATNKNADAANDAVAKLDAETAAFNRNTSAAISNAVAKAEESGVSEAEIQGIFDKYTEVWNTAMDNYSGDFDGFMGGSKSASKSGKEAGDAYLEAFEKELKDLQTLRDQGVIDEAEYLRRLRALYTRYFADRKEYLDEFKKYEREYLEGMKSLYDSALSGISKLMDSKIDSYTESKEAAIESLEAEKQAAEDAYQSQIDAIDNMIDKKQEIIDSIQDEIDAMREAREERQRQLDLQKAQYELERMQNQRTMLVYSENSGMHYVQDTTGIRDAREEVDNAKFEIEVAEKEKEIKLLEDEIDLLEKQKDALEEAKEASSKYYESLINQQEKYWDSMINNMEKQKSKWEELAEIEEIAEAYSAIEQVFGDMGYTVQDILNGNEQAFEDFKSKYISILSDMNQSTSFQEGLEYASGIVKESFGSIVSDAQNTVQELSQVFSDGTFSQAVTQGISDGMASAKQELTNMNQLGSDAGEGFIEGWNEKSGEVSAATKQTAIDAVDAFAEGQDSHSPSVKYQELAGDAIDGLLLGIEENKQTFIDTVKSLAEEGVLAFEEGFSFENSTLNTSFDSLKLLVESVTEALGIGTDETVGGLLGALTQLSNFSFNDDSIISQFNNLKTAIDEATSAISGGGVSSDGEGQGGGSGSAKGGKSGGKGSKNGSNGNSLKSAITDIGTTANSVIGQPEAEGDGTVIGEFGSLETAVGDVTDAIGSGDSKGGNDDGQNKKDEDNLIGSIINLGETTEETLGESGGDGITGRFEAFRDVIGEANEHVHSISDGLYEIDGQEVECTIKVKIETTGELPAGIADSTETALDTMNLNSAEYNAKYLGNARVEGTALASGNWAVQSDEKKSLVGEQGYEIVVRQGRFFTVGNNGAEMIDIKRGDIVFNHEQSKNLLKYGHTSGRGKAYADGTVGDGRILTPDGHILRPLLEGDCGWDLMQKFQPLVNQILKGETDLMSNAMLDHKKHLEQMVNDITATNIAANTNNTPSVAIGDIHVTCPGVTEQQVAEKLGGVLGKELDKQFNGFHNYTDQMSRTR